MSTNQTPDKNFSLRDEMKRRKQAEYEREVERRKQARVQGSAPMGTTAAVPRAATTPPKAAATTTTIRPIAPLPESRRTTIQTVAPEAIRIASRPFQNLTSRQKIMLTGVGAAVLIAIVLVGSLILAGNTAPEQPVGTPTLMAQALSDVDSVLNRFREVGVPITELKPYDLANSQVWHAKAANQFVVQRGTDRGTFTLFGYESVKAATDDVFAVLGQAKYKKWNIQNLSNMTLISPPETPANLQSEMLSHFMQYLYAPYRPFWQTATPVPSPTPAPLTPTKGQ